ncbi:histidine kinase [Seonamhaeicola algicola]|uniref:Histidine kinase n=1 Tax=Seonamhaeicola algicola TaxID=1719036 RepID=A0A5C7BAS5_9FLAO|nr:FIST N-terminal domain-containing protein [Seonamhaeicola algicola]TXE14982.1 histidine kinase [Seonamhaeicola algicola]
MKVVQLKKHKDKEWEAITPYLELKQPLVMVFGSRFELENPQIYKAISKMFPSGHIVFASTSGNITTASVEDDCLTITAIEFEKSTFKIQTINLNETKLDSFQAGASLVNKLPKEGLKNIIVLSDGSFVNGSELARGMNFAADNNVLITGGLCGDDARFERTLVSYNENPKDGEIVGIGLYGDTIDVSSSIEGGWKPFGPERVVTKAKGNILYELDNKPALDLYKKYLGEKAKDLPGAALYYPLGVKIETDEQSFVRSILNINEEYNAMIFAGDVPVNSKVQLMMSNVDNLIHASEQAANKALEGRVNKPQLALLVSCIGRKILLDQRAVEELEEVKEIVGNNVFVTGFHSYGEIAPFNNENMCQLHNQTVALTLISE